MLPVYLGMLHRAEAELATSFRQVADGHHDEPDMYHICRMLAQQCDQHAAKLGPVVDRYGEQPDDEPDRLHAEALPSARSGPIGLLRDLQDLHLLADLVHVTWTVITQAAQGLRDQDLLSVAGGCDTDTQAQLAWLTTRIKQAAPQSLLAAS